MTPDITDELRAQFEAEREAERRDDMDEARGAAAQRIVNKRVHPVIRDAIGELSTEILEDRGRRNFLDITREEFLAEQDLAADAIWAALLCQFDEPSRCALCGNAAIREADQLGLHYTNAGGYAGKCVDEP
jgi:hypothetical protein